MSGQASSSGKRVESPCSVNENVIQSTSSQSSDHRDLAASWRESKEDTKIRNAYLYPSDYYAQFVELSFPQPEAGWHTPFEKWQELDQVYANCETSLQALGEHASIAHHLLDSYGNYVIGNILLSDNIDNRKELVEHLIELDKYSVLHKGDLSGYHFCW